MTSRPERYESADFEAAERDFSPRSRGVALALGFLGGVFGLHRFYTGKVQSGLLMMVTLGGLGIWWLYDMVMLAAGEFRDADGLPLRHWSVEETRYTGGSQRRVDELDERLESLRTQVNELAERLDFAERMLAQQREGRKLPGVGS